MWRTLFKLCKISEVELVDQREIGTKDNHKRYKICRYKDIRDNMTTKSNVIYSKILFPNPGNKNNRF